MSMEAGAKVATSTIDALKSQPLALALIVINVMFLLAGGWIFHELAEAAGADRAARNALLGQMAANCGEIRLPK